MESKPSSVIIREEIRLRRFNRLDLEKGRPPGGAQAAGKMA
jgi:hypothetical protein